MILLQVIDNRLQLLGVNNVFSEWGKVKKSILNKSKSNASIINLISILSRGLYETGNIDNKLNVFLERLYLCFYKPELVQWNNDTYKDIKEWMLNKSKYVCEKQKKENENIYYCTEPLDYILDVCDVFLKEDENKIMLYVSYLSLNRNVDCCEKAIIIKNIKKMLNENKFVFCSKLKHQYDFLLDLKKCFYML